MELEVDDDSREPQLKGQSCIADEGKLAWPEVHASVSPMCEDSSRIPTGDLTPLENTTATPFKSLFAFPPSLSLSQESSPGSHISLYPFRRSLAGPVPEHVSKASSEGSDEGVNSHGQATPAKKANHEASTPAHMPSGTTRPTSTPTWRRKRRTKRRKCKKYMKKSGVGAQNVAEQPIDAAMLPDLEDVEGLLFVSFVSKVTELT